MEMNKIEKCKIDFTNNNEKLKTPFYSALSTLLYII